jgi:hypothetical protein
LSYSKLNIGLDRCKFILENLSIDGGNHRVYIEKGEKAEIHDIATGKMIGISDLKVDIKGISIDNKDDYRIKVELKRDGSGFVLDVNVPKLLYNTNERNANNLLHLSEINQIIEKKLGEVGVHADMTKARLSSIEININSTDKKLYDAMKIIRKGFNASDNKVFVVENKNKIESLKTGNDYAQVKVYNKSQQLQDTGQLWENENLVRVEISTKHRGAINIITGHNPCMDGIIENWDRLEKWFECRVDDYIKKPCDEYNKAVESAMVEKLKQGNKTYDVLAMQAVQGNLVDIEIFARAMKRYYKETERKSPATSIKNTKNRFEKYDNELYDSLVGNIDALDKLWKQIGL